MVQVVAFLVPLSIPLAAAAAAPSAPAGHGDLLGDIALCIGIAALLAFLASKFKQPTLLAYLAAGVLIGPEMGLQWITDQHNIETISEIGLILLLFMIGLEIDLHKLWTSGRAVIITGLLQFPLCLALGLLFFSALGFRLGADEAVGGPFGVAYLALAAGLSSTMIVVKLLYDKFELDTLPGRISLGILVFQDLWIIVALAFQQNLDNPQIGPLLASFGKGALLVLVSFLLSRYLLPPFFRSIAKIPELVLVTSLAWVFFICTGAHYAGLSPEMGALIAGVSISTFPYNLDVVAKVTSIRDFFVTLYFVGLGMRIPTPSVDILLIAVAASIFLIASRFVTIFPMLYLMRLGHRTSLLPAINLTQMCDFTLVFASLGLAAGHIDRYIVAILILVYAITSTTSTYMITYSHELYQWLSRLLVGLRLHDIGPDDTQPAEDATTSSKRVVFLGFFREASSILHEFELHGAAGDRHPLLDEVLVIDFNPEVHAELRRRGIACVYGDVAHMDTLHHANIHGAELIVSTIPNAILKGTDNTRLLRQARNLSPHAQVIVTAESIPVALYLYQQGADYVFLPRLHSAAQMAAVIEEGLQHGFEMLRAEQIAQLRQRHEVLA
jgi:Kef-type K+ transport system membrane component KefB